MINRKKSIQPRL